MKKAILFALIIALSACSNIDFSMNDQPLVYTKAPVRKSTLQVYVHPKNKQYRPLTAYFHPFLVQQESPDHAALSNSFAQMFYHAWTEERVFPTMELLPDERYQNLQTALKIARRRGADLLVMGRVPYFYDGSTLDDTVITIQIDIYAAGSGMRLWTMMQSGRMEFRQPDDYIVATHISRLSDNPFNTIIRSIAKDMAVPLKGWLPDPDAQFTYVSTPARVKPQLMAPPAAAPAPSPANSTGKSPADAGHSETDLPPDNTGDKPAEPARPTVHGVDLDIQFDFDKATIKQESYPMLDALGEALKSPELKGRKVSIGGHTDSMGDAAYNRQLSKRRADAVKKYLVDKWGADPTLIEAVGYGSSRPLNPGKTAADRRKNRRVEVRLAD